MLSVVVLRVRAFNAFKAGRAPPTRRKAARIECIEDCVANTWADLATISIFGEYKSGEKLGLLSVAECPHL